LRGRTETANAAGGPRLHTLAFKQPRLSGAINEAPRPSRPLREVAPQHLRERVRATIAAAPPPARRGRRRRPMPALFDAVAVLVVAALITGGLLGVREHQHRH
jgi:hypothetical protein